ncbi:hypothetical protein SNEBB_004599 [Seison nebaliae]|nr:hypothetical protein SNEBB_004599 [Seison nebaliae]
MLRLTTPSKLVINNLFKNGVNSISSTTTVSANEKTVKLYPHEDAQRDLVNYPRPRIQEHMNKVRMAFIPDRLSTYLLSKEYFVYWVDTGEHLGFVLFLMFFHYRYGAKAYEFFDNTLKTEDEKYKKFIDDNTKSLRESNTELDIVINAPEVVKLIKEVKAENVEMQLERDYRQRLLTAYKDVKKRLDYQLAVDETKKSFEKDHMINWIINNVKNSIKAKEEEKLINDCIATLKTLRV